MGWEHEAAAHNAPSVTVARIKLTDLDNELERKEAAERIAERRIIRAGRDAWHEIGRAESFEAWCRIGAALAVGKQYALRTIDPKAPWHQRRYGYAFYKWAQQHGFSSMRPSDRSHAIELHENLAAVTAWRATLPDRERRRLIGAQANIKRWHRETRHGNGKCPQDFKREAKAAWKRFTWCLRSLPASEAAPLWQAALAEVAAMAQARPQSSLP
jgi:hypothetical protein